MIEFKCHCGQPFSVENDQAGGMIQCPRCGRLNDVPTLSDLKHLDADGNYKIEEPQIVPEPERLHDLTRTFTRERVDETGREIDLRPTLEEISRAGIEEIPLSTDEHDLPGTPKYDPLTGELIEPIKVAPPSQTRPPVQDMPVATAVLGYATAQAVRPLMPPWLAIFMPENLVVLGFVFFVYLIFGISSLFFAPFAAVMHVRSFWLGIVLIMPVVAAHYVNVMAEIAMEQRDELPRPLRNLSWSEDVFGPFMQFLEAAALSFWPLAMWLCLPVSGSSTDAVTFALMVVGSTVFPAMLMTIVTSGSFPNLRPDRLLAVMRLCSLRYVWLALITLVILLTTLLGIGGISLIPIEAVQRWYRALDPPMWISMPLVLLQLYLSHYAAWTLGLLYRKNFDRFPWVYQRHAPKNRMTMRPIKRGKTQVTIKR